MIHTTRYLSQIIIPEIGVQGQQKIAQAKVLVIGAGGLGCPVLSYLAGMGIGFIGIIDDDVVEMKNLHRQVLYSEADIGKLKVQVAKEKITAQNTDTIVTVYIERLDKINAVKIISEYDLIIDCCDNIQTRYIIDDITAQLHKPFIYGAVQQMEGQISVFNYKQGPSYKHLFPTNKMNMSEPNCAIAGIIGYVTGIIGCAQVNEALKIILNNENVLSGEVLTVDLQTLNFRKFKIKKY